MRPYSVIAALLAFAERASRGSGAKVPEDNATGDVRVASVLGAKLRRRPLNQRQRRKRERRAGYGRSRAH